MEENIENKIKELIAQIPKATETEKREVIEPELKYLSRELEKLYAQNIEKPKY